MKSIIHEKDGTCYLCKKLHGITDHYTYVEEHHVFEGSSNRKISEQQGLKVYLCIQHHRTGEEAVHQNAKIATDLKREAQEIWESHNNGGENEFRLLFGKSWKRESQKESGSSQPETIEGFQKLSIEDRIEPNWF